MLCGPEYDFCLQPQRFVMYNHLNHDARLQIREICHPSEPKA